MKLTIAVITLGVLLVLPLTVSAAWGGYEVRYPLTLNYSETGIYPVKIPIANTTYWFDASGPAEQHYIYCPTSSCAGAVIKNSTSNVDYYNASSLSGNDPAGVWDSKKFTIVYHFNEISGDIPDVLGNSDFISPPQTYTNGSLDGVLYGNGNLTGDGEVNCYDISDDGLPIDNQDRTVFSLHYGPSSSNSLGVLNYGDAQDEESFQPSIDFTESPPNLEIGFYTGGPPTSDWFGGDSYGNLNNWESAYFEWSSNTAAGCIFNETDDSCDSQLLDPVDTSLGGWYDSSICPRTNYLDELMMINESVSDAWGREFGHHLIGLNLTIGSPETGSVTIVSPVEGANYSATSVSLEWVNNTDYSSIFYSVNGGTNISMTGNVTVSMTRSGTNNITVYMTEIGGLLYTDSVEFTLNDLLINCSDDGATQAVNFTFREEVSKEIMSASAEYSLTTDGTGFASNFSGSVNSVTNFLICTNGGPWDVNMILEYEAEGYGTRYYLFDSASIGNGATQNIDLYLYNETDGEEVPTDVTNYVGYPLSNVYVSFQRYYIAEDLYRTVAMMLSDDAGEGIVFLETDNVWYKFVLTQDGEILRTLGPSLITDDTLTLSSSAGEFNTWNDYNDIVYSCSYSEATEYLICTVSDVTGLSSDFCLDVDVYNVLALEDYALSCASSSSATLMINMSDAEGYNSTAVYSLLAGNDKGNVTLERSEISFSGSPVYGDIGIIITILIFCVAAGVGYWNPAASIILGTFGIAVSVILTFFASPLYAVGSLIFVGIILAYKVGT